MVVVEVTGAFMGLIIAEGTCRFLANKLQKSGSEPNFDAVGSAPVTELS
jgi:hypothetical protein